jgi:hypothetical protein
MSEKPKHPGGRPTDYSIELAEKICLAIMSYPMGLRKLCKKFKDFPGYSTTRTWIGKYPEFQDLYLKAKRIQSHILFDDVLDIANDDENDTIVKINRAKLKIYAYQYSSGRLSPDTYGDNKADKENDTLDRNAMLEVMKELANKCLKPKE